MKYIVVFIIFILPTMSLSNAQETDTKATETPAAQQREIDSDTSESPTTQSENGGNSDFGVFIPSEDISEDLSVPFPSDI